MTATKMTTIKTKQEILAMRESGRMLATVLELLRVSIEPGMTTKNLAELAKKELKTLGGQPTFLGYYGFPDVLCVSVNEEVVHGIPSSRVIQQGDLVSMDFGVTYKGMITDAAISVLVEGGTPAQKKLLDATRLSLDKGIQQVKDGARVGDIGQEIEKLLINKKLGIVRDFVGHGVGHALHEKPDIPNYGYRGQGSTLKTGMTIAIEPMATLGNDEVYIAPDGWAVLTSDQSMAAHFEHTVLVTDDGAEILTQL